MEVYKFKSPISIKGFQYCEVLEVCLKLPVLGLPAVAQGRIQDFEKGGSN